MNIVSYIYSAYSRVFDALIYLNMSLWLYHLMHVSLTYVYKVLIICLQTLSTTLFLYAYTYLYLC